MISDDARDNIIAFGIIERFSREKGGISEVKFIKDLKGLGLDDVTIAKVILVLDDICLSCFDGDTHCTCRRDE